MRLCFQFYQDTRFLEAAHPALPLSTPVPSRSSTCSPECVLNTSQAETTCKPGPFTRGERGLS